MSTPKKDETKENGDEAIDEAGQSTPRRNGLPDEILNMVGASPPKFVNFDQLMKAADPLKDMSLCHEIAVNQDFQVEQQSAPPNSIEQQVRDTVKKAFWDAFEENLSRDPPNFTMAYGMLEELKQSLFGILLPQHQRLKTQIDEVLDLNLIQQQMENEVFDFEYYGKYLTDTLAKLCAPVRDEKIAEINSIKEITPKFKAIVEMLQLMRKDMTNFTIKQARPYIQQSSVEYERKKFSESFEAQKALGINALHYTEMWLKRNYDRMLQNASNPQMSSGSEENPMPTPANVLSQAYVEIIDFADPNNHSNYPETLLLDQARFDGMRDKLHSLGIITSVQLITHSVVGPPIEGVEQLKKQMKEHVEILLADIGKRGIADILTSISEQVTKDVNDSLKERKLPPLSQESAEAIKGQISNLGQRDNRIRQIMFSRMLGFLQEGISGKNLKNLRLPKGCTAVGMELSNVLCNFLRLTSHNRSVFGSYYAKILQDLMSNSTDEQTSTSQEVN